MPRKILPKLIIIFLIWLFVISSIIIFYFTREISPVKDFTTWVLSVWQILAAIVTIAIGLTVGIIKHDFSHTNKKVSAQTEGRQKDNPYAEQWQHFERMKEAIIKLQYVLPEERRKLLDTIENERVFLDDTELQYSLKLFIRIITEKFLDTNLPVFHDIINEEISRETKQMNKRYKR
jgi:hypothetical protein